MNFNFREKAISLQGIILFCVFLATLNTINAYYYFVFIAFGLLLFGTECRVNLNASLVGLGLLGISFVIFSPFYSYSVLGMLKPFSYLFCYIIGYGLSRYQKSNTSSSFKPFYVVCVFVVAGSFFHYILNWITNLSGIEHRNAIDFWTKSVISATGQAPFACLAMAFSIACLLSDIAKKYKYISAGVIIITIAYNLILSGRTLFLLMLIVFLIAFVHRLKNKKGQATKSIIGVVGAVVAICLVFSFNLFGIMSKFEKTPFYERFFAENAATDINEDTRMDKKIHHLKNAINYPLGGCHSREETGHAHDIYLDTYDEAGIFGFLGLIVFMFGSIRRMWRCVSNKKLPFEFRQVVLCVYMVLYVQFMLEPILQGVAWLFASFCVIDGSITRFLRDYSDC